MHQKLGGSNYESNRHRAPYRRPWACGHPQGNTPNPAHPRGRPAASALPLCEGVDTSATALMPILCNGDLIGSVALTGSMPDEAMVLLVKVAAAFLGKQMEE